MNYFIANNGVGISADKQKPGDFLETISAIKPNDIIYIFPGVYYFNTQININSLCNDNEKICILGYDKNDKPIFDFRYQPYGEKYSVTENGLFLTGNNLQLQNLIIRYSGFKGIYSELSNSTIENVEVYGCCDCGIQLCKGGNNKIINCVSHDNFGYKTMKNDVCFFGSHSDGFGDKLHYGLPNQFINCVAYNNTDDGFDFFGRCTEQYTIIKNCKSYNNGKHIFNMVNYPRYGIDKEWFDQFINGKNMITRYGVTINVTLEKYLAFGNGNGFKLGGKYRYHCVNVENCEAYNNAYKGFDQNHNSGIMILNNCNAYDNMLDFGFKTENFGTAKFINCKSKGNNISILCKHEYIDCNFN